MSRNWDCTISKTLSAFSVTIAKNNSVDES